MVYKKQIQVFQKDRTWGLLWASKLESTMISKSGDQAGERTGVEPQRQHWLSCLRQTGYVGPELSQPSCFGIAATGTLSPWWSCLTPFPSDPGIKLPVRYANFTFCVFSNILLSNSATTALIQPHIPLHLPSGLQLINLKTMWPEISKKQSWPCPLLFTLFVVLWT